MSAIETYLSPAALRRPDWLAPSGWLCHLPFLFWLIDRLKPARLVELGAAEGVAYLAACQAVVASGAPSICHGIDSWLGEDADGRYGPHVFHTMAAHHDPRYGHFSRLVRRGAEEAAAMFADGAIDLLILEGNHNYDAVRRVFDLWRPLLSAKGLMLLPGIARPDFGAARLWAELGQARPSAFSFMHGDGLGLLSLGSLPAPLTGLFAADPAQMAEIRDVYGRLGGLLAEEQAMNARLRRLSAGAEAAKERLAGLEARHGRLASANQAHIDRWLAAEEQLKRHLTEHQARLAAAEQALAHARQRIEAMINSRSWRVTAPLRALGGRAASPPGPSGEATTSGPAEVSSDGSSREKAASQDAPPLPALPARLAAARTRRLARQSLPSALPPDAPPPSGPLISLIVDGAVTDAWRAAFATRSDIELILTGQASASGRNRAAEAARGEFLLFLGADIRPDPAAILGLRDGFADERVGAVGPAFTDGDGRMRAAGWRLGGDGRPLPLAVGESALLPRFTRAVDVDFCSGTCLMVRAAAWIAAGGFDGDFPWQSLEDADLCLRIGELGWRSRVLPAVRLQTDADLPRGDLAEGAQRLLAKWPHRLERLGAIDLVAFYHPDFYPTTETDLWFGTGHSGWRRLDRLGLVDGGHRPADLGYYDLRLAETAAAQEALALRYGIGAFCHVYYNFGGKRLFSLPQERLLTGGGMPFCLCFANRDLEEAGPDGVRKLARQNYERDGEDAVIRDLVRYFRQPRYLRLDGRPLLVIADVGDFPDFSATAGRWRAYCEEAGVGEIAIAMMGDEADDPQAFGCDWLLARPFAPDRAGSRLDYTALLEAKAESDLAAVPRFAMVPAWHDGPCRSDGLSFRLDGADAAAFALWLRLEALRVRETSGPGARLVFLSAWNAWAEGAYLEPDQAGGHAYLEALQDGLADDGGLP